MCTLGGARRAGRRGREPWSAGARVPGPGPATDEWRGSWPPSQAEELVDGGGPLGAGVRCGPSPRSQSCWPGAPSEGVGQDAERQLGRAAGCPQDVPTSLGGGAGPLVPGHRRGLGQELQGAGAEQEVVPSQPAAPGRPWGLPRASVAGRTLPPAGLVGQGPRGALRATLPLRVCLVGVGGLCQAPSEPDTGCRTPLLRPPASTPNSSPSHILPRPAGGGGVTLSPTLGPGSPRAG